MTNNWSNTKALSAESKEKKKDESIDWLKETNEVNKKHKIKTKGCPWFF